MNETVINAKPVRNPQLDFLRIIAMCGVVAIHVFSRGSALHLTDSQAFVYTLLPALMRWAVPLFIMLSGALLIPREETLAQVFKRVRRLVYALLLFGIPMAMLDNIFNGKSIIASIPAAIQDLLAGRSWDVLWFLYMLIGLYLLLPLLRAALKNMTNKEIVCTLIVVFAFECLFPFINTCFDKTIIAAYLPPVSINLGYFVFGYWILNVVKPDTRRKLLMPAVITAVVCVAVIVLTCVFELPGNLSSSSNMISALLAAAVCVIGLNIKLNGSAALTYVSNNMFGVYLIHCFFVNFIYKFLKIVPSNYPLIISAPLMFAVIFGLSFLVATLLGLIPFVRKNVL